MTTRISVTLHFIVNVLNCKTVTFTAHAHGQTMNVTIVHNKLLLIIFLCVFLGDKNNNTFTINVNISIFSFSYLMSVMKLYI